MEKSKTLEKTPTRLGRGLSALIPPQATPARPPVAEAPAAPAPDGAAQDLPLSAIVANPSQPRTVFAPGALDDLTASIKTHGVLQPVMVRPRGGGRYELVAGERRYRAAQEAGLTRIPAVVRSLTDAESLTVALIENVQREDLNPIEAARGYRQLMDEYGLTQTQLGEQINKQQSTISNTLRLLNLPDEMQDSICDGRISAEHGKILLSVEDATMRKTLWRDFLDLKMSRNDARDHAEAAKSLASRPRRTAPKDADWRAIEDRLRGVFGMRVSLTPGEKGGGTLSIKFSGPDALESLLEKLLP